MAKAKQKTGMALRVLRPETTHEMGYRRLNWIFDEFENVMVSVSGGKDSTVLLEMALEVAKKKNRLPLPVYWLDQEAEWQATVDICEEWMTRPEVDPLWLQVPFRIFNATSRTDHWLDAWYPEKEHLWCHPQHPIAITENVFGTDRFYELFTAVARWKFGENARFVSLSGVRAEEARTRRLGLTSHLTYKWVTWGGITSYKHQQYTLCPFYDWTYLDIWKAINEHGWAYNRIYDIMFQTGGAPMKMRVSNLTHEMAYHSLFVCQQYEPETYERLCARLEGMHMASIFGSEGYSPGYNLPPMFESWGEYRDYLLKNLVDPEWQPFMAHMFYMMERRTPKGMWLDFVQATQAHCVLANDVEGKYLDGLRRNLDLLNVQRAYVAELKKERGPNPWPDAPKPPPLPTKIYARGHKPKGEEVAA